MCDMGRAWHENVGRCSGDAHRNQYTVTILIGTRMSEGAREMHIASEHTRIWSTDEQQVWPKGESGVRTQYTVAILIGMSRVYALNILLPY